MEKFLIIDGNSILNRAFYAIRTLTTKDNVPTNAVYGFLNIFLKQLELSAPDYVSVAFDMRKKTFRHLEYDQYKAQRKGMPDELAAQLPLVKEVLSAMNISIMEQEGFEADDIIGTVSKQCKENSVSCEILTGDRDDLQLAGDGTTVLLIITKGGQTTTTPYTDKEVFDTYHMTPSEFIDLKAIMGDKSDNIPGVPGIGEVGATKLICAYHSIENIYEHIDTLDVKENIRKKLIEHKELAYLSKRLATIVTDVPMDFSFAACKKQPYNMEKLTEVLTRLELRTILNRVSQAEETPPVFSASFSDRADWELIAAARMAKRVFYRLYFRDGLQFGAFATCGQDAVFFTGTPLRKTVKELFEEETVEKIGCNMKDDIVLLAKEGITYRGPLFDTAIGAYLLNPAKSSYETEDIAFDLLGLSLPAQDPKQKTLEEETLKPCAAAQLLALPKLYETIKERIDQEGMHMLCYEVEQPLVYVLAQMELCGFKVDANQLSAFSEMLSKRIASVTDKIYLLAGGEFNINSPKQLGEVLFEKLNLPVVKKTKTGYSTNVDVLEKLQGKHEIIDYIMEFRQLTKLKSTYADGLAAVLAEDGKIHSNFKQTVTQTGRLSSTEPNLQNIPTRTDLGREIRRMFVPSDENHVLLDADYSQIELRVLAHIADDKTMIDGFLHDADIHTITASQVFGVPVKEVTTHMRSSAKAVNFGIVYGISDYSLSQDLKIKKAEAKQYIENYLSKYSGVAAYMKNIVKKAKEDGFVTTLCGRRRYLPELSSSNFMTRAFGERMALNTPIQGTAADIIKIAMVRVFFALQKKKLKSRLILQVHDELILEVPKEEIGEVQAILKHEMEGALKLSVPLLCTMSYGNNWYETK